MLTFVALLALASVNEFVLAYSDDGASALTMTRDNHEGGGAAVALRFITHDKSKRYEVSNGDGKKERVSPADCKSRVTALQKQLKDAKFTGVDVAAKACAKKGRDSIVRTLKRHSEDAAAAQFKEQDGALVHSKHGKAVLENQSLNIDGLRSIMLGEEIKAETLRVALSPSRKLLLVFHGASGGATIVYAAAIAADGTPAPIGLE
ncbi:MAG: hypothetical protein IT381_27590 [Deltaproteobacteria bacterium]|nr:hypothetical protein [Deltaproteobacteria bacterium]